MFLKTDAFFNDMTPGNTALLVRAETAIPAEFIRLYKKNAVVITPKKSGALRRSIIARQIGNTAEISWRSRYALAQNEGGHTVYSRRVVNIDGNFVTLPRKDQPLPYRYIYRNYTTPGTGPHFASIAFKQTQSQMPAVMRELGLTK